MNPTIKRIITESKKEIVKENLVLWLDGKDVSNASPALWYDKSGMLNDVTLNGFDYTAASGSDGVGGVVFGGTNDANIANNPTLNFIDEITIEILMSTVSSSPMILMTKDANTSFQLAITNAITFYTSTATALNTDGAYNDGKKHHIVARLKANGEKTIWADGELVKSGTGVMYEDGIPFYIGSTNNSYYFNGKIYLMRLYKRALTNSEILQNYKASI